MQNNDSEQNYEIKDHSRLFLNVNSDCQMTLVIKLGYAKQFRKQLGSNARLTLVSIAII